MHVTVVHSPVTQLALVQGEREGDGPGGGWGGAQWPSPWQRETTIPTLASAAADLTDEDRFAMLHLGSNTLSGSSTMELISCKDCVRKKRVSYEARGGAECCAPLVFRRCYRPCCYHRSRLLDDHLVDLCSVLEISTMPRVQKEQKGSKPSPGHRSSVCACKTSNDKAPKQGKQEETKSESDFAEVIKKESFIDKTQFLKDLLEGPDANVVLSAPHRSGKTTVIDMIRRFVGIDADEEGRPKQQNITENYSLFKDHNLDIFKHQDVVDKHFGKYPVLLFNFQPLSKIVSHYELLEIFKKWLREAHTKYRYLLHERNIWIGPHEKSHFEELMEKSDIKYGPSYMIQKFTRLCELLYIHFQKPIFALVDDYNAFLDSPEISFNFSNDYVVSFIHNFSEQFFTKNKFLGKVFITGVHRENGSPLPEFKFNFPPKTVFHNFTDKHPVCQLLGKY